jgi:hypothetical protein
MSNLCQTSCMNKKLFVIWMHKRANTKLTEKEMSPPPPKKKMTLISASTDFSNNFSRNNLLCLFVQLLLTVSLISDLDTPGIVSFFAFRNPILIDTTPTKTGSSIKMKCCGSRIFIPDPDFYPYRIPDLGSRISEPWSRIPDIGSRIPDLGSRISDLTTAEKEGGGGGFVVLPFL